MKNLKQLKDALNKLSDKDLDKFYITHAMRDCEVEPEIRLDCLFEGDEEDHLRLIDKYQEDGFEVILKFIKDLNKDVDKIISATNDQDIFEKYCEEEEWDFAITYEDKN